LEGYRRTRQPATGWRIIFVDNASVDDTPEILRSYERHLPLTIVNEPAPGKNRALNRALVAEAADLFIFSDDDAIPDEDFLLQWELAARSHREFSLFGGTVEPRFQQRAPNWLLRSKRYYPELFAENHRDEGPIPARAIFGPNMAVSGALIASGMRFSENIGPNCAIPNYAMGSETEFCVRAETEAGGSAYFWPHARVQHIVRPHQMTKKFFAGRAYRHGQGVARQQIGRGDVDPWRFRTALVRAKSQLHRMRSLMSFSGSHVEALWQYHWLRGFLDEIKATH